MPTTERTVQIVGITWEVYVDGKFANYIRYEPSACWTDGRHYSVYPKKANMQRFRTVNQAAAWVARHHRAQQKLLAATKAMKHLEAAA